MSTKNYHHAQKNSYHSGSSPNKSLSGSERSDVYDHLYNVSKPIHITVYRNGDPFDAGVPVGVTRTQFKNWLNFLDYLTERLQLPDGAVHNVYTVHGEEVRHFKHLKQDGVYVGAKGEFKESDYGGKDTRRMKWQIRHASAKPEPSAVMSKESREMYLEQKGFRPKLDDIWDVANFDQKGSSPMHHSLKSNHETMKKQYQQEKPVNKHLSPNSPKKGHQAQQYNQTKKATPISKTHLKDNAYRIHEQGKTPVKSINGKSPVKSRFPPIHTGSLVEMQKSKNEKEVKNSIRNRSNSAPETLHNKQMQAKKHHEVVRSSKSNLSEPKNFSSNHKNNTMVKNHNAKPTEKSHSLKPPDGKNWRDDKKKKSPTRSVSPSLKSVTTQTRKSVPNKHTHIPDKNRLQTVSSTRNGVPQSRDKRSKSQDRRTSPEYHSSQKRNKSAESGRNFYSRGRQSPVRRTSNYNEDYYDKERSYKNEEDEEYYEEERRRDSREIDEYYDEYDNKVRDEYEREHSPVRSRRNSYRDDDYIGKEEEASTRLRTSSYPEPEYPKKDEYGDYHENRDHYRDEPDYYENDKNVYEDDYDRKTTPKPSEKQSIKRSKLPVSTSRKQNAEDKNTPKWANELTMAVRELASEVHNLGDYKK